MADRRRGLWINTDPPIAQITPTRWSQAQSSDDPLRIAGEAPPPERSSDEAQRVDAARSVDVDGAVQPVPVHGLEDTEVVRAHGVAGLRAIVIVISQMPELCDGPAPIRVDMHDGGPALNVARDDDGAVIVTLA